MMTTPTSFVRACASAAIAAAAFASGPAVAAPEQTFLGQHGDWYAYRLSEEGARTCYMVSKPTRTRGSVAKRGDVVAFVTHRPKEGERDVVSFQAGYAYRQGSEVAVAVGDDKFSLFTSRDTAWARNPQDDKALVQAMIKGITMTVEGAPVRGDNVVDTYSLRGFTAAYKRITAACGLK